MQTDPVVHADTVPSTAFHENHCGQVVIKTVGMGIKSSCGDVFAQCATDLKGLASQAHMFPGQMPEDQSSETQFSVGWKHMEGGNRKIAMCSCPRDHFSVLGPEAH